jgi:serine/threonine protein kinase
VAIKQPRLSGLSLHKETAERLIHEARVWDRLDDHEHIVTVLDYGTEPFPWIGMEYMDGGHLGERVDELSFSQALWTAIAISEAMLYAHHENVAHLDLKPTNILFRQVENGWDVPKVADWGLSKFLVDKSKSSRGLSPAYAAPEQFDKGAQNDDITDIYQLGAVFYELFTGRPPFKGSPMAVMRQVERSEPTPPSEIAAVPPALDKVVLTAMAKNRSNRFDYVVYLRDKLRDLWPESVEDGF